MKFILYSVCVKWLCNVVTVAATRKVVVCSGVRITTQSEVCYKPTQLST